jgi:uncharacterized protein YhfF
VRNNPLIANFWQRFLATHTGPSVTGDVAEAGQFGAGVAMGNQLAALIVAGTKTATCSCLWEWEHEAATEQRALLLPQAGDRSILLNGDHQPVAVIETTAVAITTFEQVDAGFAFDEGEDDRSLARWREMHWAWFTEALKAIGRVPTPSMPLVCERFCVIYRE